MNQVPGSEPADAILSVVLELLESGGHDAVQTREVARRARVSPLTIYKLFPGATSSRAGASGSTPSLPAPSTPQASPAWPPTRSRPTN
ncbi:helix-turn-helix domain-containing protein [Parafrankia sp. BMG5.11]|uniref:helix-turn-helix domain-containing protein n=1 Tax=Parafrankia sp. BMG5.11 TaxID=222540 RepID=UPI000DA4C7BD